MQSVDAKRGNTTIFHSMLDSLRLDDCEIDCVIDFVKVEILRGSYVSINKYIFDIIIREFRSLEHTVWSTLFIGG